MIQPAFLSSKSNTLRAGFSPCQVSQRWCDWCKLAHHQRTPLNQPDGWHAKTGDNWTGAWWGCRQTDRQTGHHGSMSTNSQAVLFCLHPVLALFPDFLGKAKKCPPSPPPPCLSGRKCTGNEKSGQYSRHVAHSKQQLCNQETILVLPAQQGTQAAVKNCGR